MASRQVKVRFARAEDAPEMVRILRSSIIELCGADHGDDSAVLEKWLANKTVGNVELWLANPLNRNVVAERDGVAVGCASVRTDGHILLNYVAASARFQGASDAMLAFLEALARDAGLAACTLESTLTAHRFYLRRGYLDVGAPGEKFGIPNFSMRKPLSQSLNSQTHQ